jgi:DNA-binding response OmpR family regulator
MAHQHHLSVLLIGCPEPVVQAVRESGHRTVVPAVPEGGLDEARFTFLDVVILDLAGAGSDPFALARGIRAGAMWRKPMFLALTETLDDQLDARCRNAGFDLLLVKPVRSAVVAEFLGRLNAVVQDYESFDPAI